MLQGLLLAGLLALGGTLVSLLATAAVLVRLPADHFVRPRGSWKRAWEGSLGRKARTAGKNFAGIVLVGLGAVLSIPGVPAPGLLIMLAGLFLMDFPGKVRIQAFLLRPRRLRRGVNRLRARFGRRELEFP